MISVIMSVYNEKHEWVDTAIQSILDQTFSDFEFIIVLDNPDRTDLYELILKYSEIDSRIIHIINKQNEGLTKSLNKAIELSRGKYIARMDADDISMANRLEKQISFFFNNSDIDLVGTNAIFINEDGVIINRNRKLPERSFLIKKLLKYNNYFIHPTWMFKREIFFKIGFYKDIYCAEDYDFICRLIIHGYRVTNINEYLFKYRRRSNSIMRSNQYVQYKIVRYVRKVYRKGLKGIDIFDENVLKKILSNENSKENLKLKKLYLSGSRYKNNGELSKFILNRILCAIYSNDYLFNSIDMFLFKLYYSIALFSKLI